MSTHTDDPRPVDTAGDLVEVRVSVESEEEGRRLAERLVRDALAACAQVLAPMTSVYRWEGQVRQEQEHLVLVKTTAGRVDDVAEAVGIEVAAQVPELLAVPVSHALTDYAEWVREQTR